MMEPVLDQFAQAAGSLRLHPPQLAYISSVTGTWITAAEATDPFYWARQLRYPVRFADSLQALLQDEDPILVEAGPGRTLYWLRV